VPTCKKKTMVKIALKRVAARTPTQHVSKKMMIGLHATRLAAPIGSGLMDHGRPSQNSGGTVQRSTLQQFLRLTVKTRWKTGKIAQHQVAAVPKAALVSRKTTTGRRATRRAKQTCCMKAANSWKKMSRSGTAKSSHQ